MIKALFKFDKNIPKDAEVIDTTSNSGEWSSLSPFILSAPPAKRFENLWQYSKVYPQNINQNGSLNESWYGWSKQGFEKNLAVRYPMGKGVIPVFSLWQGQRLGYIDARKQIYIPEYSKNVVKTEAFKKLQALYDFINSGVDLVLLDYDAYDHKALGMTLKDVVNNPKRKCGHAFVLISLLTGEVMV